MKRLLVIVAATAAAAFTPLASANSPYDYVAGAGERIADNPAHFEVSALDGPRGASGEYQAKFSNGQAVTMNVTCLYIKGNIAVVGGVMERGVPASLEGLGLAIAFQDNGNPAAGGTPDKESAHDIFAEPGRTPPMTQADCIAELPQFGPTSDWNPLASGNVEIYDAP